MNTINLRNRRHHSITWNCQNFAKLQFHFIKFILIFTNRYKYKNQLFMKNNHFFRWTDSATTRERRLRSDRFFHKQQYLYLLHS